jgi:hypothetical protein
MAITIPIVFTEMQDAEIKYNRSISEETCRKMAQNVNLLGKLAPIGCVRAIQLNQLGVQAPDTTIWQVMDGSEITLPQSPLRTMGLIQRFVPDMTGRYPRGANAVGVNNYGGNATVNLSHSHSTGGSGGSVRGEEGDEKTARLDHTHPISNDLSAAEPLEPAHQRLAFYLKIT